jgi:hypothetical protein
MQAFAITTVLVLCLCIGGPICMAQTEPAKGTVEKQQRREEAIRNAISGWQAIFGPVDFSKPIFDCMIYLHPKPMKDFLPLTDKKLSSRLALEYRVLRRVWTDTFFKGSFRQAVVKIPATKYYLRSAKVEWGKTESDLLLYEGEYGDESIRIMESSNVCLLTIRPKDYQPNQGIDVNYLSKILFDRVRLAYPTQKELNQAFKLVGPARLGSLFINNHKIDWRAIAGIDSWTDCVFLFVGNDGVSLFLFKAQAGRAAAGFPYDLDWLKEKLDEKEGVVGHESTTMQKSEIFTVGQIREVRIDFPQRGFIGDPLDALSGIPTTRRPTKPEDFVTRFARVTVVATLQRGKGKRAVLRLDEIDKKGAVLVKELYYVYVDMMPEGTQVLQRLDIMSKVTQAFQGYDSDDYDHDGVLKSVPYPLACTTPVALLLKRGKRGGYLNHTGLGVEYSWGHPDHERPAMIRVEAARLKNPRKSADDIPHPIYWHGAKIPDVGNGRKTERIFRETQEWKNADDWLWTKMERFDMEGNVLLRCEAMKVKDE